MYIHVVNRGDVMWKLADYYHSTIPQILEANGMTNPNQLLIGQSLVIPSEDYYLYKIRPKDTLWNIANKYKVTVNEILLNNTIENPNNLIVGTLINIPQKPKPTIEVNGYTYMFGDDAASIINEVGDYLTYMSPFAYLIRQDGTLQPIKDDAVINAAIQNNTLPMMCITNFSLTSRGENLASVVLNNPQIVEALQNNILSTMRNKRYVGVNIDFENVLPKDREAYNNFLASTVNLFHREGYFVSTALAPKESAEQRGVLYEAHDYPFHGRVADFVVLMTYEWGWRGGPPQAISPIDKMRSVLEYAVSVMPRDKILMGFQIYARDWVLPHVQGQIAETFSEQEAMRRAYKYDAIIRYDEKAQSPYYNYTDEQGRHHEVWFEDARSAQAKFDLAKEFNLRGISYWALGYPFPQNWILLHDNFNIKKY